MTTRRNTIKGIAAVALAGVSALTAKEDVSGQDDNGLRPCRKVRELVDELARLKAEFREVSIAQVEGAKIWNRMCDIRLEIINFGYVALDRNVAVYAIPIDNYYVALAPFKSEKKR